MSNLRHVRIENPGPTVNGTRIFLDGNEVHNVSAYTLHAGIGEVQRLTLTMFVGAVDIDVEAVEIVDSTANQEPNGDPT